MRRLKETATQTLSRSESTEDHLERIQELEKKLLEVGAEVPKSSLRDRISNIKLLDGVINN